MIKKERINILLIDADSNDYSKTNKTADCILRAYPDRINYLLAPDIINKNLSELSEEYSNLAIPIIKTYDTLLEKIDSTTTIIIGYAPVGGKILPKDYAFLERCIELGAQVINGTHHFITNPKVTNLRKHGDDQIVATGNLTNTSKRILTVGTDFSIGKMTTTLAIYNKLREMDNDIEWLPTGQTGMILNEGKGHVLDSEIIDFVPGGLEKKINEYNSKILLIEGQGSIFHAAYSPTALALFHTSKPQHFVLCHKLGSAFGHMGNKLPTIKEAINFYKELGASLGFESNPIGVSLNCKNVRNIEYLRAKSKIEEQLKLPCFDVVKQDGLEEFACELDKQFTFGRNANERDLVIWDKKFLQ